MKQEEIKDIKTARRCLLFVKGKCKNYDCENTMCPLNKFWEDKHDK